MIKSPLTTKILQQQKNIKNTTQKDGNETIICYALKTLRSFTMWIQLRGPLFFFIIFSETFELKAKINQCQKVIISFLIFIQIFESDYLKSNWFDDEDYCLPAHLPNKSKFDQKGKASVYSINEFRFQTSLLMIMSSSI